MSEQIITKRCSFCKQTKSLDEFSRNKTSKDKHHNQCKVCKNKGNSAYHQTEKGRRYGREYMRKRRKTKKGKFYEKQYLQSEKYKNYQKQYRQNHLKEKKIIIQ